MLRKGFGDRSLPSSLKGGGGGPQHAVPLPPLSGWAPFFLSWLQGSGAASSRAAAPRPSPDGAGSVPALAGGSVSCCLSAFWAAMIFCRSVIREHFSHRHSFQRQCPAWPLTGTTKPWLRQREHLGARSAFAVASAASMAPQHPLGPPGRALPPIWALIAGRALLGM